MSYSHMSAEEIVNVLQMKEDTSTRNLSSEEDFILSLARLVVELQMQIKVLIKAHPKLEGELNGI